MIDTGKYQNSVNGLSSLSMKDYERIFKIYESEVDGKIFPFYNILNTINFPEIDSSYLDTYNVESKMAWTTLSYNIYGDIKSWWILYLLNKDKFDKIPFYVNGGTQIIYIIDSFRSSIYQDITLSTIYANRHY